MSEGNEHKLAASHKETLKPSLLGPYYESHDPSYRPAWIGRGQMEITPIRDPSYDMIRELAGLIPSKMELLHLQQGRDALYPTPINNPVTTVVPSRVNSIRTWIGAVQPLSPNASSQPLDSETHETEDV
jgi:hypothetical protein